MKKVSIIVCLFLFMQACVINPAPIDVEIGQIEPEMVINSYTVPPSIFALVLTRSFSALAVGDTLTENDGSFLTNLIVDPAEVIIRYNEKEVELTKLLSGAYGSVDVQLEPYVEYELQVTDLLNEDIMTAKTTVLPKVDLVDITYEDFAISDSLGSLVRLKYIINDPPDEDNFYLLGQVRLSESQLGSITDLIMTNSNYQIISDKEFPGQAPIEHSFNTSFMKGDTMVASLTNITEQYYDYLIAYKRIGNIFSGFLSEPVRSLPSNIEGGLGYFNLATPTYRQVILE